MYFITCFQKYEQTKYGVPDIGDCRTFGYYPHKEWAIEDLHNNNVDIHEDMYDYAVVEKIPMGLYPLAEEKIFFKWDEEKQGFFEVDGAEFEDNFGNYAFGLGDSVNNFKRLNSMSVEDLAEWLDQYGQFDNSPWITWFDQKYCKNCEDIMCKYEDGEREFPCSYCELNGNCKFFPDLDEAPDNKRIIKMWLESNI